MMILFALLLANQVQEVIVFNVLGEAVPKNGSFVERNSTFSEVRIHIGVRISPGVLIGSVATLIFFGLIICFCGINHWFTSTENQKHPKKQRSRKAYLIKNGFRPLHITDGSSSFSEGKPFTRSNEMFVSGIKGLGTEVEKLFESRYSTVTDLESSVQIEDSSRKIQCSLCRCFRISSEMVNSRTTQRLTPKKESASSFNFYRADSLPPIELSCLIFLTNIATGSFSAVNKMSWRREGFKTKIVAVKWIKSEKSYDREKMIAAIPYHNNVVHFLGETYDCNLEQHGIVMPYYEQGNLKDILYGSSWQKIELETITKRSLMVDIARGLEHLHNHKIIHRDVACRNVLIERTSKEDSYRALISDFGLSCRLQHEKSQQTAKEDYGPLKWMAPEAFKGEYSQWTDVYSFGMALYEIMEEMEPFNNIKSAKEIKKYILSHEMPVFRCSSLSNAVMPGVLDIIRKCWHDMPSSRPVMSEIVSMLNDVEVSNTYHAVYGPDHGNTISRWSAEDGIYRNTVYSSDLSFGPSTLLQCTGDDGEIDEKMTI